MEQETRGRELGGGVRGRHHRSSSRSMHHHSAFFACDVRCPCTSPTALKTHLFQNCFLPVSLFHSYFCPCSPWVMCVCLCVCVCVWVCVCVCVSVCGCVCKCFYCYCKAPCSSTLCGRMGAKQISFIIIMMMMIIIIIIYPTSSDYVQLVVVMSDSLWLHLSNQTLDCVQFLQNFLCVFFTEMFQVSLLLFLLSVCIYFKLGISF